MGIFDFLKAASKETSNSQVEGSFCPYCFQKLEKIPLKKTACPHCSRFILVRTRPKDRKRVLVTEEQAKQIEEEWSIASGTHDHYLAQKAEYEKEKESLRKQFGKEPSENDIQWRLCNKYLLEHARNNDWGLYRNTRLQMGDILKKELKLKEALITYLEVCYLDLNGPNNRGCLEDPELLKEYPPFDPSMGDAFLAPGVIEYIAKLHNKLNLKDEVRKLFIENNNRIQQSLKLPLSVGDAWVKLESALHKPIQ